MRTTIQLFTSLTLLFCLVTADAFAQRAPQAEAPQLVRVSAASPNPFTASSQFTVTVDRTQEVTVELYNLLGQRVKELFSGRLEGGESQLFTIQADALPPGLYLYRVQSGQTVVSRQVTLLR